MFDKFFSEVYA